MINYKRNPCDLNCSEQALNWINNQMLKQLERNTEAVVMNFAPY